MTWIKRILGFSLLIAVFVLANYYLPKHDIVQIVDTDSKRMDINTGSPFWDSPDVGSNKEATRDVRFIYSVEPNGKTKVFRNEDTGWSFPFYLKFDSSDLTAAAEEMAREPDQWVSMTYYGWRIKMFSIWPNATDLKPVEGPNVRIIPWFNIVFLTILFLMFLWIYLWLRKIKRKHIDPVTDKISDEFGDAADAISDKAKSASGEFKETRTGVKAKMKKWFGS